MSRRIRSERSASDTRRPRGRGLARRPARASATRKEPNSATSSLSPAAGVAKPRFICAFIWSLSPGPPGLLNRVGWNAPRSPAEAGCGGGFWDQRAWAGQFRLILPKARGASAVGVAGAARPRSHRAGPDGHSVSRADTGQERREITIIHLTPPSLRCWDVRHDTRSRQDTKRGIVLPLRRRLYVSPMTQCRRPQSRRSRKKSVSKRAASAAPMPS